MNTPTLKLQEENLQQDNPWADDALQRKSIAQTLTNFLQSETNPLVIGLHGSWGSGKTFLLKRWKAQLKDARWHAIYFNAWEDDYCGDPLVAIIGQLRDTLKDPKFKVIRRKLMKAATPIFKNFLGGVAATATCNILNADALESAAKELKSSANQVVHDYFAERSNRDSLKKSLTDMANKVAGDTGHPLVFIVDELDRCRPTFSIRVLERIKHLFDIPNMVFVLGIDRKQLCSSIQAVYGNIDVDGYLRRFIDIDFTLPPADAEMFCKHLIKRHDLNEYFQMRSNASGNITNQENFTEFEKEFPFLCKHAELSLRDVPVQREMDNRLFS